MADQSGPPKEFKQRVVRVFVSSTFRDMHDERNHMATHVFPELRHRCRQRQVEFVEVDLRWGITEEQSQRGEVLPICLAEIERCRPYFIGLLGERYGWVSDKIDPQLIHYQPWLEEHLEKSITELEILHGVLNNPAMADRSYFYFRDPAYIKEIPEAQQSDFLTEDAQSRAKLERLKDGIRKSGLLVVEDYSDPEAVGKLILDDLWAAIDKSFPEEEVPDPLDHEIADHEAFAQSRAKIYIGRNKDFQRLEEHAQKPGPPLVLVGESGVGKSALVAKWALRHRKVHPEDFIILHFIGSSPRSADYVALLRRIMAELKRRYDLPDDLPETREKLKEEFSLWLARASAASKGRIILVLDGLNQLEDQDNAPDLGWLPYSFGENVRVILSTLAGRSMDAAEKREWPKFEIEKLDKKKRRALIVQYLAGFGRKMDKKQRERIVEAVQTANPLYLRALLEELRVFGIFEKLGARIDHYLEAQTVPDLYEKVLERMEQAYEKCRPALVRDAMSFIWASRRGLFESEILELLGSGGSPLPRAFWSPLFFGIEESLVDRSGLLNFFHDYLRQAVQKRCLDAEKSRTDRHVSLGKYFEKRETDDRKADELPWQWQSAGEWERLKDSITDLAMFHRLTTEAKQYELMGYWLKLGDRFDMVKEYGSTLAAYEATKPTDNDLAISLSEVAFFLRLSARFDGAEPLYKRSLAIMEKAVGPEHPDVAKLLNNLVSLYWDEGTYSEGEPLCQQSLAIKEKLMGPDHAEVGSSLDNLAWLYWGQGKYSEAEPLCRQSLAIYEKALGPEHRAVAVSLNSLAYLCWAQGRYAEAEPLYKRSLAIEERALGPDHPEVAAVLRNLATLYGDQRKYSEAEPLRKRSLTICTKALGPEHPEVATSLNNLAELYRAQGRHAEAEPLYKRSLVIREKVLGPEHPHVANSLNNLAELYRAQGRHAEAEPLCKRSLVIREKVLGPEHQHTRDTVGILAAILRARGDDAGLAELCERFPDVIGDDVEHGVPDRVSQLFNQALALRDAGSYENAAKIYRQLISDYENFLSTSDTRPSAEFVRQVAICHNELAFHTYVPAKEWQKAEYHYKKAVELASSIPDPIEAANMELNLLRMHQLAGQPVDVKRAKELIKVLEDTGDPRAEKKRAFLEELDQA